MSYRTFKTGGLVLLALAISGGFRVTADTGEFSATPLAAGHLLYCVNEKGLIQVVDISKTEGEILSELDSAEQILSTPSLSNGAIYFRSRTRLWKFSSNTVGDDVSPNPRGAG